MGVVFDLGGDVGYVTRKELLREYVVWVEGLSHEDVIVELERLSCVMEFVQAKMDLAKHAYCVS